LIQYRSVTDTHTHTQTDTRRRHIPRLARRRAVITEKCISERFLFQWSYHIKFTLKLITGIFTIVTCLTCSPPYMLCVMLINRYQTPFFLFKPHSLHTMHRWMQPIVTCSVVCVYVWVCVVQKWLNQLTCRLGCRFGLKEPCWMRSRLSTWRDTFERDGNLAPVAQSTCPVLAQTIVSVGKTGHN